MIAIKTQFVGIVFGGVTFMTDVSLRMRLNLNLVPLQIHRRWFNNFLRFVF